MENRVAPGARAATLGSRTVPQLLALVHLAIEWGRVQSWDMKDELSIEGFVLRRKMAAVGRWVKREAREASGALVPVAVRGLRRASLGGEAGG